MEVLPCPRSERSVRLCPGVPRGELCEPRWQAAIVPDGRRLRCSRHVCFADGCGDPTRGIAVEITGGSTVGLFPQDFLIQLGTTQNFELQGPLAIVGSFQRERSAGVDPTNRSIYLEEVVVRATGESEILPGVARSYQARFAMTDRGTFSTNVGQGTTLSPLCPRTSGWRYGRGRQSEPRCRLGGELRVCVG